jgi:hypothetical protein
VAVTKTQAKSSIIINTIGERSVMEGCAHSSVGVRVRAIVLCARGCGWWGHAHSQSSESGVPSDVFINDTDMRADALRWCAEDRDDFEPACWRRSTSER